MLVETFEEIETTVNATGKIETPEETEAIRLAAELGLEGQGMLLVPQAENKPTRLVPYPQMNKTEAAVYKILFPKNELVTKYRHGPIPLRVLQVIAHALPIFRELQIWHDEVPNPDPILVGLLGVRYSNETEHLLARWGKALLPFGELKKLARARWLETRTSQARAMVASCQNAIARAEVEVERALQGEWVERLGS